MTSYNIRFDELFVPLSYIFCTQAVKETESKVENKEQCEHAKKEKKNKEQKPKEVKNEEPAKKADELDNLFDDEEETPKEETKEVAPQPELSRKDRLEAAKKAKESVKKVERSLVTFEVKPYEIETDLVGLFNQITSTIALNGLTWGEKYLIADVAYGIKKLVMTCVVVDDLVGTDDFVEPIQEIEDVQSVDVCSMNRI